jgi:hypothetical protein
MRFNEKSDVQKHFSNRKTPLFLHKAKLEDYTSAHVIEPARGADPPGGAPMLKAEESLVHSSQ